MEIRQFRVVVRARDFDRTCRFYGEVLALPRLQSWDRETGRGALYQAGSGAIEVHGRPHGIDDGRDESFEFYGPIRKLQIVLTVPNAEKAYEELLFRDPNVPGALEAGTDGAVSFSTHDPDGVVVILRPAG
jgi:catechol 2,3-dioxygenase-like lactoylglutathione lyase family enzyme